MPAAVVLGMLVFHFYGLFQGMAYLQVIFFLFHVELGYAMALGFEPIPKAVARANRGALMALGALVIFSIPLQLGDRGYRSLKRTLAVERYLPDEATVFEGFYRTKAGRPACSAGPGDAASSTSIERRRSGWRSRARTPISSASRSCFVSLGGRRREQAGVPAAGRAGTAIRTDRARRPPLQRLANVPAGRVRSAGARSGRQRDPLGVRAGVTEAKAGV